MTIRAVFFDAGDTLVHRWVLKAERFLWLCEQAGMPADHEVRRAGAIAQERFFQGRQNHENVWSREWFRRLNRAGLEGLGLADADLDRLAASIHDLALSLPQGEHALDPEALPLLSELRARGCRLAVISNWDGTLVDALRPTGLGGYFDAILDSQVVGSRKPDTRMFEIACAAAGVRPDEAVHVGDSPGADVAGALRAGVHPVLLDALGAFHTEMIPGLPCHRIGRLSELPALLERL